jgi:hypothetical protein
MSGDPPYRAAVEGVDPNRLLPEEERDLDSDRLEDAVRWLGVYGELVQTKRTLIRNLRELMGTQSQAAQDELEAHDIATLKAQVARFEARQKFWRMRASTLKRH